MAAPADRRAAWPGEPPASMPSLAARLAAVASRLEERAAAQLERSARAHAAARRQAARLAAAVLPVAEEPVLRLLVAQPTEAGCSVALAVAAAPCEPAELEVAAAVQREVWVLPAAWPPRSSSLRQSKEA